MGAEKRKGERRLAIGAPKKFGGDPVQPTTGRTSTPTAAVEKTETQAATKKKKKRGRRKSQVAIGGSGICAKSS